MATKKASTKKSAKKTAAAKTASPVVKKSVKTVKTVSKPATLGGSSAVSDMFTNVPLGALFGEFIGTFMLAAVVIATSGQPIFVLFGLVTIVLTVGHLSGAHVNPAITFGAWITRKISTKRGVFYILAQVLGAMFALVLLQFLLNASPAQQNMLGQASAPELFKATQVPDGKEWYAIAASVAGLAVFAFAVASAMREKKEHIAAAFTVGGGLFIGLIIAGQTAILNPAVAVSLKAFTELKGSDALGWAIGVHVIAPFIGAAIGFLLYDLFRKDVDQV